jgi:adenylate cyclase
MDWGGAICSLTTWTRRSSCSSECTARPRFWGVHMWLAGALGLQGDFDGAPAELAEARRLSPKADLLARWRMYQPWIAVPEYQALREKTLNVGLRPAGFAEE